MPNTIYAKPYMQIVEDVMLEVREAALTDETVIAKYKRRVNDVYSRIVPDRHQYEFMKKQSTITLTASYEVGTVAINAGSTSLTGTGTVWTAAMTGRKMWIGVNDTIYTFTRSGDTTGTISPALTGSDNLSGVNYAIFVTDYELQADYGIMTTELGIYYDQGRGISEVDWYPEHLHLSRSSVNTSSHPTYFREIHELGSNNFSQIQIWPPVNTSRVLNYEYYRAYPEMVEFTTGTASTTANSTSVTTNADYSANITAGQYFRIDPTEAGGAAQWVKITLVSTTTLTVSPAYTIAKTNGNYTVCDAPDYPSYMQHALFLGTCWLSAVEMNDTTGVQVFGVSFEQAMSKGITREARKRYGRKRMRLFSRSGGSGIVI